MHLNVSCSLLRTGGEAYLPMTPTGQSPMSSYGLKPAKVVSYLSDDSMSGEFPKRAYSVGSRPNTKPLRHHPIQDIQKKQVLDNSRSSSAPHLIVQKSRSPYLDSAKYQNPYDAYQGRFDTDCFNVVLLDSRPRGLGFKPLWRHWVVYLGKNINIGINHGFECVNIRRVPRKVFEHEAEG